MLLCACNLSGSTDRTSRETSEILFTYKHGFDIQNQSTLPYLLGPARRGALCRMKNAADWRPTDNPKSVIGSGSSSSEIKDLGLVKIDAQYHTQT
jgi:hypothetical protein